MYRLVMFMCLVAVLLPAVGCQTEEEKKQIAQLQETDREIVTSMGDLHEKIDLQGGMIKAIGEQIPHDRSWIHKALDEFGSDVQIPLVPVTSAATEATVLESPSPSVPASSVVMEVNATAPDTTLAAKVDGIASEQRELARQAGERDRQILDKLSTLQQDVGVIKSDTAAIRSILSFKDAAPATWQRLVQEAKDANDLLKKLMAESEAIRREVKFQGEWDRDYLHRVVRWLETILVRPAYPVVPCRPVAPCVMPFGSYQKRKTGEQPVFRTVSASTTRAVTIPVAPKTVAVRNTHEAQGSASRVKQTAAAAKRASRLAQIRAWNEAADAENRDVLRRLEEEATALDYKMILGVPGSWRVRMLAQKYPERYLQKKLTRHNEYVLRYDHDPRHKKVYVWRARRSFPSYERVDTTTFVPCTP